MSFSQLHFLPLSLQLWPCKLPKNWKFIYPLHPFQRWCHFWMTIALKLSKTGINWQIFNTLFITYSTHEFELREIGIRRFRSKTCLSLRFGIRRFKNGIRRSSLRIHFHPLLDTFKNDLKKLAIRGKPTILWFSAKKLHHQTGKSLRVTGKKESEKSVSINPSKLRGKQGCNSLGQVV